jgi:hypothetical protein
VDICPACLEKYLQGKTLAEMGILQVRPSPCKCEYCGASGEKGEMRVLSDEFGDLERNVRDIESSIGELQRELEEEDD